MLGVQVPEVFMFDWLRSKPEHTHPEIRDALFGDIPLSRYASTSSNTILEPLASFVRAKQSLDSGDPQDAIKTLRSIIEMPGLESNFYLQAWFFLRGLGVHPSSDQDKEILGVLVEVGMGTGSDLIAAYPDHRARYYNYSGSAVIWERPNGSLNSVIDDLLKAGAVTIKAIGPWKDNKPPAPPKGYARINLLSPSGLHFGQGPLNDLSRDQLGAPVMAAAFRLMQELIRISEELKGKQPTIRLQRSP